MSTDSRELINLRETCILLNNIQMGEMNSEISLLVKEVNHVTTPEANAITNTAL